jgi:hypothetical protein
MPVSAGVLYTLLEETGALSRWAFGQPAAVEAPATDGCRTRSPAAVRVNTRVTQDCSLRAQASASLAINPLDESNLLVSQDDSRVGFGHCSFAWTRDGAGHWGDETPPFFEFQLLDGHAADAWRRSDRGLGLAGERLHRRRPLPCERAGERDRRREVERRHPRRVLPLAR